MFIVFHLGTLEATFYGRQGEILSRTHLAAGNPQELVDLDETIPLPRDACRVTLGVRDADGESRGVLGNAIIGWSARAWALSDPATPAFYQFYHRRLTARSFSFAVA